MGIIAIFARLELKSLQQVNFDWKQLELDKPIFDYQYLIEFCLLNSKNYLTVKID